MTELILLVTILKIMGRKEGGIVKDTSISREAVIRTTIEHKLNVKFPGEQPFFGLIGEPGMYGPDHFEHQHTEKRYAFPEGTVARDADRVWDELVSDASKKGKTLFSNDVDPNISLVRASVLVPNIIRAGSS